MSVGRGGTPAACSVAAGIVAAVILLQGTSAVTTASVSIPSLTLPQESPPHVVGSLIERDAAPGWLQLPPSAQIELPSGVALEVISTSILSEERRKEAVLVGLFRNTGRQLNGATLTLSFVGPDGATAGSSLDNDAKVSEVATNGFLPFRFPLTATTHVPGGIAAVRLSLAERSTDAGRSRPATLVRYSVRAAARNSTVVTGQIDVPSRDGSAAHPRLVATMLLLDQDSRCIEILTGELAVATGNCYPFEFRSPMPVGKGTRQVRVWVEDYPQ
jgi:hypothetical protein